jgi:hypothetical protein
MSFFIAIFSKFRLFSVIKKLRQNFQACLFLVFLCHNIAKNSVIKILFNHIELGVVTMNKSMSESLFAAFIDKLFTIATSLIQGKKLIYFKYFSVFFI